jgi:hypothetical protein
MASATSRPLRPPAGTSHRARARAALALALLAGSAGCFATARRPAAPTPSVLALDDGARIRVSSPVLGREPRIGHFIAVRGDTLFMWRDVTLDSLTVPLSSVRRLEVSAWHGSHTKTGAIVGAVLGAGVGALMAKPTSCTGGGSSGCSGYAGRAARGQTFGALALGGALGGGIGALVGRAFSREKWAPVSLGLAR